VPRVLFLKTLGCPGSYGGLYDDNFTAFEKPEGASHMGSIKGVRLFIERGWNAYKDDVSLIHLLGRTATLVFIVEE
jgi:hypothetical protein